MLVLPPKYLPELRMLSGSKLSASDALVVSVLGQYSGVDVILKDRQAYDVTRVQLTKSLRKRSNSHSAEGFAHYVQQVSFPCYLRRQTKSFPKPSLRVLHLVSL